MINALKIPTFIFLLSFLSACSLNNLFSNSYNITIDGIRSKELNTNQFSNPNIKYIIEPNKGLSHDLRFEANARYLAWALNKQGYIKVDKKENADVTIKFSYKGNYFTETHSEPIYTPPCTYQKTEVTTTKTKNNTTNKKVKNYIVKECNRDPYFKQYRTYTSMVYSHAIELKAINLHAQNNNKEQVLWQTSIQFPKFYQNDERTALKIMFAAAFPYISADTNGVKNIPINDKSPYLTEINNF